MNRQEPLETALLRFRTHPFQTALTLAGLIVGTASIILTISLGLTGRRFVMSQIEGVGSRLIWAIYNGSVSSGIARDLEDRINDGDVAALQERRDLFSGVTPLLVLDRKSTRLNSSHVKSSYAVFCLKKKKKIKFNIILKKKKINKIYQ